MASVVLKPGRERSLLRLHPWIFSGAIGNLVGNPQIGQTIDVISSDGKFLAKGAYSPHSQIVVRIWSFDSDEVIDSDFFKKKLDQSISTRAQFSEDNSTTAFRLVNAESDGLPGLIVDRYGEFLVCQFLTAGAEQWKNEIIRHLANLISCSGIYERSDVDVREKEGLTPISGVLSGKEPPSLVEIKENNMKFWVDIIHGHKTGFYLDQRDNRILIGNYSKDAEVLNCFAYTGGFGISALIHGARHVTNVESSDSALDLLMKNAELNRLDISKFENVEGDVFQVLRNYRNSARLFDLIILDPPKFAESKKNIEHAARGYKDINLLAFKLLRPGGILFTFSCSGLLTPALFQKIVADAAVDARRYAQIIQRLSQATDHPTALSFPEGTYLKGLVCRVK